VECRVAPPLSIPHFDVLKNKMSEESNMTSTIITNVLSGLALSAVLILIGWITGPFKWIYQSRNLKKIIYKDQGFTFVYNPESKANKNMIFGKNGMILEGENHHEKSWRIRKGKLELLDFENKVYSRFSFDKKSGNLNHTNDPDTESIRSQYLIPNWKK